MRALVHRLATTRIGETYNQYADSALRRDRLTEYLERHAAARLLLVGEAAGYRGARVSGIPFTSERQLTGEGPAEATATIVQRVLDELGLAGDVLLWNVVPTHPGTPTSNRRPTTDEIRAATPSSTRSSAGGERSRSAASPPTRPERRTFATPRTAARLPSPPGWRTH